MPQLLTDTAAFIHHTMRMLHAQASREDFYYNQPVDQAAAAGVLFLLGLRDNQKNNTSEYCLILNKRSLKVRQPGDLCFPGGSVARRLDPLLARFFSLPITSLGRWKYWSRWRKSQPQTARRLTLFWATGLRESFEEMRLNPFGLRFLGPLPPQSLVMFRRTIYPLAALIERQKRFFPNWEVDKIVYIPLRELLDSTNYRRYRLNMQNRVPAKSSNLGWDYPCFQFRTKDEREILWGATYRITTVFMEYIFGFKPPDLETLPVIEGCLDQNYMTGYK